MPIPRVFRGFAPNHAPFGLPTIFYNTEHLFALLGDTSTYVRGQIRKSSSTSVDKKAAKSQGIVAPYAILPSSGE
jgi:hypothetical protein